MKRFLAAALLCFGLHAAVASAAPPVSVLDGTWIEQYSRKMTIEVRNGVATIKSVEANPANPSVWAPGYVLMRVDSLASKSEGSERLVGKCFKGSAFPSDPWRLDDCYEYDAYKHRGPRSQHQLILHMLTFVRPEFFK